MTAYADDRTLQRAKLTEPVGYILKPFEERELRTTIETALYRHHMERRLKESQEWFATMLRCLDDAVIAVDRHGAITFMNLMAEDLTGWMLQAALGRRIEEILTLVRADTHEPLDAPEKRTAQQGSHIRLAEHGYCLVARNRAEVPIRDGMALVTDDFGNRFGLVVGFHALTEPLDRSTRPAPPGEPSGRGRGGQGLELQQEVNHLLKELGRAPKYPAAGT